MANDGRANRDGLIDRLRGPRETKRRLRILLASLAGTMTVSEACAELGVGRSRFHVLRRRMLRGMLDATAAAPETNAPSPETETDRDQLRALHARIDELERALHFTALQGAIVLGEPGHRRLLRKDKTLRRR